MIDSNNNSIHFLNTCRLNHYRYFEEQKSYFKEFILQNNLDLDDYCISASSILSAYGLREGNDLDYLHKDIDYQNLDESTKISYRLMEKRLQRTIDNDNYIFHNYMITHRGGKHSQIPSFLINYHKVDEEQDIKDYIGRLRNVEPLMNDLIEQLRLRQDVRKIALAFVFPQAIKTSENIISGYPFEKTDTKNVIYNDFMNRKYDANYNRVYFVKSD